MQNLEVEAGVRIGPVRLGMDREQARLAMAAAGLEPKDYSRWPGQPDVLMNPEADFQVFFDREDRAFEIQLSAPSNGARKAGARPAFEAMLGEVDVFASKAADVIATIDAAPDEGAELHGLDFSYPQLGLLLWRDDDRGGKLEKRAPYFEGVLVRRPR